MRKFQLAVVVLATTLMSYAQDPHYSQFFAAPHLMNPANSGSWDDRWQFFSNYRQQWANAGTPFNTFHALFDGRITNDLNKPIVIGGGLGVLSDQSLSGALKSNYLSGSLAFHLKLSASKRVGLGFIGTSGRRNLDFSQLTFGQQFTSGGFDPRGLPSGEPALANMKPFFSLGVGGRYEYKKENLKFDFGAATYHINRPKQTFLSDPNQIIPIRYVGQFNLDYKINSQLSVVSNICYQSQALQSYFSVGGALGYDFSDGTNSKVLYLGSWYRESDAIYPYAALRIGNIQVGLSYDATVSKQNASGVNPQSLELSLIVRPKIKKVNRKNNSIDSILLVYPSKRFIPKLELERIRLNRIIDVRNDFILTYLSLYACKVSLGFLPSIQFLNNLLDTEKSFDPLLASLASQIRNSPGCRIVVIGSTFSNKYEKQLSWDRVASIINYLVEKEGISKDRFIFKYESNESKKDAVILRLAEESELDAGYINPPHPYLRIKLKSK